MSENIVTANEKYAEDIGMDFGRTSNVVQAALLNGFAKSMDLACQKDIGMQVAYVADLLTPRTKEILRDLGWAE